MSEAKISEAVERLERAYVAGMDEEFRDDLRVVLDALSQPAELADLYRHLLDMLGAKSHEDAGRIIGELHGKSLNCTCPSGDGSLRWPCPKHPPAELAEQQGVDEHEARGQIEFLDQQNHSLRRALSWYEEQVSLCRKVGSLGEPGRHALDRDGGERARAALAATGKQQVGEAQVDARAQFEAWAKGEMYDVARYEEDPDLYLSGPTRKAWAAWQAAIAARQPGAVE